MSFTMRPMDDAPKDGREIIVFTEGGVVTVFWKGEYWQRVTCTDPYSYYPCDPARHGLDPARFVGWASVEFEENFTRLPLMQRLAWNRYLAGEAVPISQLPTNGQHCPETTIGGVLCGHPLLIGGSCTNAYMHGQPDLDITDAMIDAALAEFPDELVHLVAPYMGVAIEAALRAREDCDA